MLEAQLSEVLGISSPGPHGAMIISAPWSACEAAVYLFDTVKVRLIKHPLQKKNLEKFKIK